MMIIDILIMSNWFTTALQTVRDKVKEIFFSIPKINSYKLLLIFFQSTDALDFVRRDLTEFTTTVKNDTEGYLNKIRNQEVETKKIFFLFIDFLH